MLKLIKAISILSSGICLCIMSIMTVNTPLLLQISTCIFLSLLLSLDKYNVDKYISILLFFMSLSSLLFIIVFILFQYILDHKIMTAACFTVFIFCCIEYYLYTRGYHFMLNNNDSD